MIFFFNAQGDTINFVPENVHQGSNNANKIYVVAPLSEANQVLAYFTLPNGKVVQPVYGSTINGLTNLDNLQIEGKSYSVWVCNLSDIITSVAGTVQVQFAFINGSQKTTTQSGVFKVLKGVSPYEPLDLSTETTWDEILAYISNFIIEFNNLEQNINEKFENLSTEIEKDFEELTNEIKGDLENGLYPVNYDIATNRPIFNVELPINNPTMGYYRHVGESTDQFTSGGIYYFDGANFSLLATEKKAKEYTDKEIATVNQKIDTLHSNAFVSVNTLPTASAETLGKIYLVPTANPNQVNVKNEYITIEVDGNYFWEVIGSTEIDISGKSAVTVNGEVVETFDADTKLNRITDNAGFIYLYSQNTNGADSKKAVGVNTFNSKAGNIPQYFAGNAPIGEDIPTGVLISGDPVNPYHTANKNYVDSKTNGKLDAVTTEDAGGLSRVYGIRYSGEQFTIKINQNAGPSQICVRDSGGRTKVNAPVHNLDAANKQYVDEQVANAGGGGGKLYKRVLTFADGYKIIAYSSDNVNVSAYATKSEKAEHLAKYYTNSVCYFVDYQNNTLKSGLVTSIYIEDPSGGMVEGAEEVAIYIEPFGNFYAYESSTIETITEV